MRLKHLFARIVGPAACAAASSGCSNDVRQVPLNEVREGGTYVVAALETRRPASEQDVRVAIPANAVLSYPVTPPNVRRDEGLRKLGFVRAESNHCVGSDELVIDFPSPETGVRYVAFALPPGHYVGRAALRAADDFWT